PQCASNPPQTHKKTFYKQVSKPVMEKKRRARINKCLDQLKTLLESCYSSNIRKRKLEKADILELTVKHLKNLQKIQSFTAAAASEFSEYQTGFRSCLSNVNQYLVMADTMNAMDHWMLTQLSSKLSRSVGRGGVSSTMDSAPTPAEPQEEPRRLLPLPGSPEEAKTTRTKAPETHTTSKSQCLHSEVSRQSPAVKRAAPSTHAACSSPKTHRSVITANKAVNIQNSVWRPW
uniref:Hairy-related 3 n=1 Tax=Cynoglossus semilaevis TaxID=244447 RepID=A0A3P8WT82_CYNSE